MYLATKLRLIFGVCFLSLFFMGAGSEFQKAPGSKGEHPFQNKLQRRQSASNLNRSTFEKEVAALAQKISAARLNAVSGNVKSLYSASSEHIQRLQHISGGTLQINWHEKSRLPIFIRGKQLQEKRLFKAGDGSEANLAAQANAFLEANRELLQIRNPQEEFRLQSVERDEYGLTHLRYQQMFNGLEVWARDVRVHLNREGIVDCFNGRYIPTPAAIFPENAAIAEEDARAAALRAFNNRADEVSSRQLIYVDDSDTPRLAWLVNVKKGLLDNWRYFIDAQSGAIIHHYNHIMTDGPATGSGVDLLNQNRTLNVYEIGGTFLMIDASKPMFNTAASNLPQDGKGVIYTFDTRHADSTLFFVTSTNVNSWNDRASVSASANGALVFDFYNQNFNRNAIDGKGSTMNLVVNFKTNFNNAFWNGQFMVFGNGDGNNFSDLAAALDVTAHEMTHGVVENSANLVYENQPGALNESFADVFGVLFEFWVEGANGDWLIGEDVTTPNIAGDALRNMENPAANVAFSPQPTKMSEFQNLPNTPDGDHGGVHVNSGIPNRAFFLFANSPAVGLEMAGKVYYQALTNYLTRHSQFIDCRLAVIRAVDDVFGAGTNEAAAAAAAAAQAFDTVEIFDGSATPPPPTLPPVEGQEFLAVISAATGQLVRYDINSQQFTTLTNVALFSRPTVTDDGEFIFYVDNTTNLHLLASDGSSDQQLTNNGGFSNVAISPNGRFLAATSIFEEPIIYIFDLVDGSGDKQIQLYTPTYSEGTTAGNVLFPDRIDWASDSEILMYDAFNIVVNASGDTTGYWDINLLRTSDGLIARLFPPQPPGVDIGNAVFSSNSDNIIAFDYVEDGEVSVLGVNLLTGDIGEITFNFNSLGSPSFSNDDRKVYYHYIDQSVAQVWVVDLLEDGITGAGNDQGLINGGVFPVAFAIGERPTSVEDEPGAQPSKFTLHQNYPNPFNPETTIRYELPNSAEITLNIYDIKGRLVAEIDSGLKEAGAYSVRWNGRDRANRPVASGIYFYRLEARSANGRVTQLTNKMTLLQ